MDYHYCGVVEMLGVHDEEGIPCGREANTLCYDCGTSLCPHHAERCSLCVETFCQFCLTFHRSEHTKPAQSEQPQESRKKKTA